MMEACQKQWSELNLRNLTKSARIAKEQNLKPATPKLYDYPAALKYQSNQSNNLNRKTSLKIEMSRPVYSNGERDFSELASATRLANEKEDTNSNICSSSEETEKDEESGTFSKKSSL